MANLYLYFDSTGQNLDSSGDLNINSLEINGAAPGNNKYLTTDGSGNLTYIDKPLSQDSALLHFTQSGFNFNSALSVTVLFELTAAYDNSDISYNAGIFTINTAGVYRVEYSPQIISSASYVSLFLQKNGNTQNIIQINQTGTNANGVFVSSMVATDTISILSNRIGGNNSAKNNLVSTVGSPLLITRLS